MTTIPDALIQIIELNGGQYTGINDLIEQIPGSERMKKYEIKQLEQVGILIRSTDCNGGRGHKRTVYLIRLRRLSPCGKS